MKFVDSRRRPYLVCKLNAPSGFLNASLCSPECFPEECDALQQRRLQQQCQKHGAGHHTVL